MNFYSFMNDTIPFPCSSCGQCCRRVSHSNQTKYLDGGDGVCRYLDKQSNLCSIYEDRPLVCRVEDYYQEFLQDKITWISFVEMNVKVCEILQKDDV